jgi:hypothetical protein
MVEAKLSKRVQHVWLPTKRSEEGKHAMLVRSTNPHEFDGASRNVILGIASIGFIPK